MKPRALFIVAVLAAAMLHAGAVARPCADPKIELGASLAGFMIHTIV